MRSSFQVTGIEEYIETLEKASKDVNKVSREALADAGKDLLAAMRSRCRVDKLLPYIQIFTPSVEGDFNYVAVGFIHDLAYTPKETAILANVIEFGSVHNAAMPFIRPAVSAVRASVNRLIAARLKAATLID
jgi:HK97 gp10 family phage protein